MTARNLVIVAAAVTGLFVAASCARKSRTSAPPAETLAVGEVPGAVHVDPGTVVQAAPRRARPDPKQANGNTIAPMPVPGEDSAATMQRKLLNLPKFGDYVYVTELPEAQERVEPVYPEEARRAGVSGTVMVQALIDDQGSVVDTRIIKSIPLLDAAADKAVREWHFKPARNQQGPTAVWVGVPVTFTLH